MTKACGAGNLKGYYSFVENFRRDGKSPGETRRARYGNGWVRKSSGDWVPITRSRFTADGTPLQNIDAGVADGEFTLSTGGDVQNKTRLRSELVLPDAKRTPPEGLPKDVLSP